LVAINNSQVLVETCRNSCKPSELYVLIHDASSDTHTPAMVCIGCAFCGRKIHRAKIESALDAWAAHNKKQT